MRFHSTVSAFLRRDRDPPPIAAIRLRYRGTRAVFGAAALALGLAGFLPARAAEPVHFTPNPQAHSIAVDWVEAMLLAIQLNPPAPTATTWRMLVATTSMYNAWSAYDNKALSINDGIALKRDTWEHTDANKEIAVSHAAYHSLSFLFPNQQFIFDEVMALHGMTPSVSTDITTPEGIGRVAARKVIDSRLKDGSNARNGFAQIVSSYYPELYAPVNSPDPNAPNSLGGPVWDPNHWTPLRVPTGSLVDDDGNPYYLDNDPGSYRDQSFLTPHWGAVTPYALTSGDQFRPPAPPRLGSDDPYTDALGSLTTNDEAYRRQAQEVLDYSAELTDEHKIIAEFWADGPGTWTPPGHWMQLANGISIRDGHGIDEDIRMYMAIAGAVFDAGIVAWDAKRAYDFVRPASAIRYLYQGQQVFAWGGPNQGARMIDGGEWQPYQQLTFVTPAFAEFTSGHSTFSAAAAHTLIAFTGSDALYDGVTAIGRDYDRDGTEDLLGQHLAMPGTMMFEEGPAVPVVLRWETFSEAAEEAGISRLYGGIHFQDGNLHGQQSGKRVGDLAYQVSELYWDPFGKISQTVEALGAAGHIDGSTEGLLVRLSLNAESALAKGQTHKTCSLLQAMGEAVYRTPHRGRWTGEDGTEAKQHIAGQLSQVSGLLCSAPRVHRPPARRGLPNLAHGPAEGPGLSRGR
jgi:hypothetical protein